MKNVPETLPTDVTALQELVVALRAQNDDLIAKNQRLSDMFRLAQQKHFGNSSESYPGQGVQDGDELDILVQKRRNKRPL